MWSDVIPYIAGLSRSGLGPLNREAQQVSTAHGGLREDFASW